MMAIVRAILILSVFSLIGCAAALVPASNDPKTKINQATQLFLEQGRAEGAVTLLNQAILLAREQNDKRREAIAEFYLGEIYKAPGPNFKNLLDPQKAAEHHKKAVVLNGEIKFYKNSAFASWSESQDFVLLNNMKEYCRCLREGEKSYSMTDADDRDQLPDIFANGKLLDAIRSKIKEHRCR
jgi:tetratricopeptide (TPR) repeat protein